MTSAQVDALVAVAVDVARAAANHVRRRRPELFGGGIELLGRGALETAGEQSNSLEAGTFAAGDADFTEADVADAVSVKSTPTDPVTLADTETEQIIRDRLGDLRPDDQILGEEEGGSVAVPSGVRWVVDPIDGTVNFMYGIPAFAVSVAAQVDGRSVAGAVVDVARDVVYWAGVGCGAYAESAGRRQRLWANPVDRVDMALVATGFGYGAQRRAAQGQLIAQLLPLVRDVRRVGAAALDLCMVASGAVDAHFEHGLSPWDWAAGALIAAEAGAVVYTPPAESRSVDGIATIAAAPGIAEGFVALLDSIDARRALTEQ